MRRPTGRPSLMPVGPVDASRQPQDHLQHVFQILDLTTDMGTLVIAAGGNAGRNIDVEAYYPARHPRVLSIGATHKASRRIAGFSNRGRTISAFAPGIDINFPVPGNRYEVDSGTSFSLRHWPLAWPHW